MSPASLRAATWVLVASVFATAGCEAVDPMRFRQQKYKPYQQSSFYPDGLSMRDPPAGTVARGSVLDPALATGRDPKGGLLQKIPLSVTPALLETGRKRFDVYCAVCHGLVGDGRSVVATKMSLRPPPSIHDFRERPDGFFFQVVTEGFGLMPSYAMQMSAHDRWAVVAYVRALQLSQRAPFSAAPVQVQSQLEKESP